jgi:hypothetical protein
MIMNSWLPIRPAPEPADGLGEQAGIVDVRELDELDGDRMARGHIPATPDLA